ncbi:hypothetical protein CXB51_008424 [Gossypium anomalum]|uniref:DUF4283 domain-containing protein n=1 Tax=Gossypium anomalum TaxID=47600 RepID=A0A8J5ZK60_9ROSI|nr:hypothetical protein CXB51_008424 [Gossypium anomalum]
MGLPMADDISEMLERLKLSEKKSAQVISINIENIYYGYESWVVGKIMAEEKPNREAMYRVFRSLWFIKEEINFVALKEEVIIFKFGYLDDRSRILNLMPWLFDNCLFSMLPFIRDRQTTMEVRKAIGKLVAIDWKDRDGAWIEFIRLKIKINISKPLRRIVKLVGRDRVKITCVLKYERMPDFCYFCGFRTNEGEHGEMELKWRRLAISPVRSNEDLLLELPWGWKPYDSSMDGCLTVDAIGKSGGLALLWRKGTRGDFNAILNNSEKEGGRRKSKVLMDDFSKVVDELSLIDLKTINGWFTWVNNREGDALVKERLDHFMISANDFNKFPFIETKVIRQVNSDHDAIVLDTDGRKSREESRDPRLRFRYDPCWAKEKDDKNIIKNSWFNGTKDIMEKIDKVGQDLGKWQYKKYKEMSKQMGQLKSKINRSIDNPGDSHEGNKLKALRSKLSNLMDQEEKYWA